MSQLLAYALRGDSTKLREAIPEHVADLNTHDEVGRTTPLHAAARSGNPNAVKALLEARANVHARDATGATPLVEATRKLHAGAVRLLLDFNADPLAVDDYQRLPVDHVVCDGAQGSADEREVRRLLTGAEGTTSRQKDALLSSAHGSISAARAARALVEASAAASTRLAAEEAARADSCGRRLDVELRSLARPYTTVSAPQQRSFRSAPETETHVARCALAELHAARIAQLRKEAEWRRRFGTLGDGAALPDVEAPANPLCWDAEAECWEAKLDDKAPLALVPNVTSLSQFAAYAAKGEA